MSTPTREDYELAAKAAGLTTDHDWNAYRQTLEPPVMALVVYRNGELLSTSWNPYDDDGDSRRLQIACRIDLGIHTVCCDVSASVSQGIYTTYYADHNNDKAAAARAAVFWLAVEIGRAMP